MGNKKLVEIIIQGLAIAGMVIGMRLLTSIDSIQYFPFNLMRFSTSQMIGLIILLALAVAYAVSESQLKKKEDLLKVTFFTFIIYLGLAIISGAGKNFNYSSQYASILILLGVIMMLLGYILNKMHFKK